MKHALFLLLPFAAAAVFAQEPAQDDPATSRFQERWESSLEVYREQSGRIADEKIPLLRRINALEDQNLQLRHAVAQAQQATADDNRSFDALRNQLESAKAQSEFAERFLREYLDSFESRMNTAEDQLHKDNLTKLRLALDKPGTALADRLESQLAALDIGIDRASTVIGGYAFEGKAITPDGLVKPGTVFVVGPAAYFSDVRMGGDLGGMLRFQSGTIEPALVPLPESGANAVRDFVRSGGGLLPIDVSLGNALALESTNVKLTEHVARGGPVGYAILGLGFAAFVLVFVKLADLRRFQPVGTPELQAIVQATRAKDDAGALALARKIPGPAGEMMETGVRNVRASLVLLEELMLSVILRRRPEAERFLPFLAITAVAAPLLGLLGTVVGMIRTFALITVFGTGDPRALSSGISEALVTTELGLMVAIPTLIAHSVLTRMIRSRSGDLERAAFEFVKNISVDNQRTATA